MREDGRLRLRPSHSACRVRQKGHLRKWDYWAGRQKDGPKNQNQKAKSLYNCTTFFHFFQNCYTTFWRFTGHDGFLYLRTLLFSLRCIPPERGNGQKQRGKEEEQRKSWRGVGENDEKYTLLYTPFDSLILVCFREILSLLSVRNNSSYSFSVTVPESVARNNCRLSILNPAFR